MDKEARIDSSRQFKGQFKGSEYLNSRYSDPLNPLAPALPRPILQRGFALFLLPVGLKMVLLRGVALCPAGALKCPDQSRVSTPIL